MRAAQGGPSVRYRDYARCLPDYLRAQAERAYSRRNSAIAKLTTEAAIRERQRWVTRTFRKLNGGMPERMPLKPRTLGSFEREGYRVEKAFPYFSRLDGFTTHYVLAQSIDVRALPSSSCPRMNVSVLPPPG